MKQILSVIILLATQVLANAQSNDDVIKRNSVGFFGNYYMSSLQNSDDMNGSPAIKLETTLRYGAGVESVRWFTERFGHGFQLGYFNMGQDYSGLDTISKNTYKASTTFNNLKVNYLVHFHSFNRYRPQAKLKFNSFFGPYVALNSFFKDNQTFYDANGKELNNIETTPLAVNYSNPGISDIKLSKPIYKPIDLGFTFGAGIEYLLTRKMTIYLNLRTDIGVENVENRGKVVIKSDIPPYDVVYNRWDQIGSKFGFSKPAIIDKYDTRPATKNFAVGAALGIRVYNVLLRN